MSDNKASLPDMITASVDCLIAEHSGSLINPEAKHSINAEMLNMILTEIRSKLTGLEYTNELRSKISECRILLQDIVDFNINIREDIEYIRELLTCVIDDVEDSCGSEKKEECEDGEGEVKIGVEVEDKVKAEDTKELTEVKENDNC